MIDSHLHLDKENYHNLDEVIKRANKVGVKVLVTSGYDYKSSCEAIQISEKYPSVYTTVGLHPSEVHKEVYSIEAYLSLARHPKVVGIGEIGLDYYWDKTYKELQKEIFHRQLALATKLNLPIVIHSREAIQDTYDILQLYSLKGSMHCYSGSFEMAQRFIKLGFLIGIGGVVTFKNASLRETVQKLSLGDLLSETDSPYLAPHPYRGKQNFPEYIPIIVNEIATLKNVSPEEVRQTLHNNFTNNFTIKESL